MSANSQQNPALDFTKGALVLLMLLYHWINYFVAREGEFYTYIRFITPSFIFIAGFLASNVYPSKHAFNYYRIFERLLQRGIKLLLLFTILNLLANILFVTNYRGQMPGITGFLDHVADIYISGNAKSLFWVLLPISYFLPIAGALLIIGRGNQLLLRGVCCLVMLCITVLSLGAGSSANLEMLGFGVLGLLCGTYPIDRFNGLYKHPVVLGTLYLAYTAAITIWGVLYILQLVGVCLNVSLIYLVAIRHLAAQPAYDLIVTLGRYSLFGYITQIGILHFVRKLMDYCEFPTIVVLGMSFMVAYVVTIVTVVVLDEARKQLSVIRRMYQLVFS